MARKTFEDRVHDYIMRNPGRYNAVKEPLTLTEAVMIAKAEWRRMGLSESTLAAYTSDLKEFKLFAHRKWSHPCYVQEIDKYRCADFRAYLYDRGDLRPASIQRKLDAVSSLFNVMVKLGYISHNPIRLIEDGKIRRRRVPDNRVERAVLTIDGVESLLSLDFEDKWGLRDEVILYCLLLFAPRNTELRELRWWHLDGRTLTIPRLKANLPGTFQVPTFLLDLMYAMRDRFGLNGDDPIFVSQYYRELSPNGLRYIIRKHGEAAGIRGLRPKDFRTFLLSTISKRCDPYTVQKFIGHRRLETASRFYVRRTQKELQAVFDTWAEALQDPLCLQALMEDERAIGA
ncbi:MAG: tyrosine-type recombinase/integrase [Thermoflavifilum sp.]|nr:tyrosine-type recombinase/integrase [Thermoflavifilum sp.]MCL6514936.1 tyrosine-type recombinase/integrase [Alicyclobacillus sp.]